MPKKHPDPLIRKLHMTESTGGHFAMGDDQPLREMWEERRKKKADRANLKSTAQTSPQHVQGTTRIIERQIQDGKHALAVEPLTRLEIQEWHQAGVGVAQIAKTTGLSISLVKAVLEWRERLLSPQEREKLLAKKYLEAASLLSQIMGHMTDEKMEKSSFAQLALGFGLTFDKMLLARKSLDGEAASQIEMRMEVSHDRDEVIGRIRTILDQNPRLRSLVETQVEVKTLEPPKEEVKVLSNQVPLFQDQESKLTEVKDDVG